MAAVELAQALLGKVAHTDVVRDGFEPGEPKAPELADELLEVGHDKRGEALAGSPMMQACATQKSAIRPVSRFAREIFFPPDRTMISFLRSVKPI